MALWILRSVYIVFAAVISAFITSKFPQRLEALGLDPLSAFFFIMVLAGGVLAADVLTTRKSLDIISSLYFGVIVGLFFTYIVSLAIAPLLPALVPENSPKEEQQAVMLMVQLVVGLLLVYLCTSLLMQTRNDFRFVIPYVEFAREVKGVRPFLLDTCVVIDGRIADLVKSKIIDQRLIMPQFVLAELQSIADSSDKVRRSKGRRGLDILQQLQINPEVDLEIYERELPELRGQPVDMQLMLLGKHIDAKILTTDSSLDKVARLQGVDVINLNTVATALKPAYLPGETLSVKLIRPGEESTQGVGYLDDGTMVVVAGGRDHLHQRVEATVTSTVQTRAGRMIFGQFDKLASGNGRGTVS